MKSRLSKTLENSLSALIWQLLVKIKQNRVHTHKNMKCGGGYVAATRALECTDTVEGMCRCNMPRYNFLCVL